MLFNGSNINENVRRLGQRPARARSPATSATSLMDLNDVEAIDVNALGGADIVTVNDLSGTDVTERQRRPRAGRAAAATPRPTP